MERGEGEEKTEEAQKRGPELQRGRNSPSKLIYLETLQTFYVECIGLKPHCSFEQEREHCLLLSNFFLQKLTCRIHLCSPEYKKSWRKERDRSGRGEGRFDFMVLDHAHPFFARREREGGREGKA